ncbi:MAG: hypothetical protein V8Q42_03930 [Anaerovoracaceae bacterium]
MSKTCHVLGIDTSNYKTSVGGQTAAGASTDIREFLQVKTGGRMQTVQMLCSSM